MLRHARSARLVDGADEVHLSQIGRHLLEVFQLERSTRTPPGPGCCSGER